MPFPETSPAAPSQCLEDVGSFPESRSATTGTGGLEERPLSRDGLLADLFLNERKWVELKIAPLLP